MRKVYEIQGFLQENNYTFCGLEHNFPTEMVTKQLLYYMI